MKLIVNPLTALAMSVDVQHHGSQLVIQPKLDCLQPTSTGLAAAQLKFLRCTGFGRYYDFLTVLIRKALIGGPKSLEISIVRRA